MNQHESGVSIARIAQDIFKIERMAVPEAEIIADANGTVKMHGELAFSGFVDLLRLSADEGDFSKPVRCSWSVIGETLAPVRASCGIQITPWETFEKAEPFDYVVVVGGLLHSGAGASDATLQFIRRAATTDATLVGICTGVFSLMRAGVLDGYRICVSWFHYWDFVERFPGVNEEMLVADRLFVMDHRRITCSGGRASIFDMRKDAPRDAIDQEVREMQLSPPSAFITKWVFRLGLLRAAYTREALEAIVSRSRFEHAEIVQDGIGFELRLNK